MLNNLLLMRDILINKKNYSKYLLIISIISCVLGPHLLSFEVGINLYFFRWFMLLLFFIFFTKKFGLKQKNKINDWLTIYFNLFMLIWLIYSFMYIFLVDHLNEGIKALMVMFFAFVYIFVYQCLFQSVGVEWFYYFSIGIFISYLLSIIICFWELSTFNHLPSQYFENLPEYSKYSLSTTAFSGNPNNFSVFLILSSISLYYLWEYLNIYFKTIITFSIFIINPVIIFLNESRLALIIYLFLMVYFFYKFIKINSQVKIIIFFLISILSLNFKVFIDYFEAIDLAKHIIQEDTLNDDSNSVRFTHFKNFIYYMEDKLGLGLGPGQYEVLGNAHPYKVIISNPHNLFLEIGLNFGIYILLLFCILLLFKLVFYFNKNQLFFIFCFLFVFTTPINSSYLNDNLTWMYLALIFNGFSGDFFLNKLNSL